MENAGKNNNILRKDTIIERRGFSIKYDLIGRVTFSRPIGSWERSCETLKFGHWEPTRSNRSKVLQEQFDNLGDNMMLGSDEKC